MSRQIRLHTWESAADFERGTLLGTALDGDRLVIESAIGTRTLAGVTYEWAAWLSPETRPGFGGTELVGSWNAHTPVGTWLELEARWAEPDGALGRWYSLGRWAETDEQIRPTSVDGQSDESASVDVDVLKPLCGACLSSYQLRITLYRLPELAATPEVSLVAAAVSDPGPDADPDRSADTDSGGSGHAAWGTVIDVPAYSQLRHRDAYPEYSQGGASWCSPTATTMVLHHWGQGPEPSDYAWVDGSMPDRFVPHAARRTFDLAYGGSGNWAFNTAYAATFGTRAFVTRLRSLEEAELFIAAGVPLIASVVFTSEEADGAGYATDGHLLVVVGFDERGNVVTNDPASQSQPSNERVRTTFDRRLFERAWLERSAGNVYVVHPSDHPLPEKVAAQPNW